MMDSRRRRFDDRGMSMPIALLACTLFAGLVMGIRLFQGHETRMLTMTMGQQRAQQLAEAGIQRAMARYVAKSYGHRWYRSSSDNDGQDYQGIISSENVNPQSAEDVSQGSPIDPNGKYEVFIQDCPRYPPGTSLPAGTQAEWETIMDKTMLDHTDFFSVGIYDGGRRRERVVIYARAAIVPEPKFFRPEQSPAEAIKRIYVYRIFYDRYYGSLDVINDKSARDEILACIEKERIAYHENFLRTRELAMKLRKQPLVDFNSKTHFTKAEIDSLFSQYPPLDDSDFDLKADLCQNLFAETMIRLYQISDNLGPSENLRYEIPPEAKAAGPLPPAVANVRRVFFPDENLHAIHPAFMQEPSAVDSGDKLVDYQKARLDLNNQLYMTNISNCWKSEFNASIPLGHATTTPDGGTKYLDNVHMDAFNNDILGPSYITEMDPDAAVIGCENYGPPTMSKVPIPISLCWVDGQGHEIRLPVGEFLNYYMKYIDSRAKIVDGVVQDPSPIVPPPAAPPPPPPPPPPPTKKIEIVNDTINIDTDDQDGSGGNPDGFEWDKLGNRNCHPKHGEGETDGGATDPTSTENSSHVVDDVNGHHGGGTTGYSAPAPSHASPGSISGGGYGG